MSEVKSFAQTQTQDVTKDPGRPVERQPSGVLLPPVDVYEDDTGITLIADLPGVASERLNVQVDKNTLLIEGEAILDTPEAIQALYAEVRNPLYRRSFALSRELDTEAVEASLEDGVLTVRLRKKAPNQPRKIQIQTT